MAGRPSTARSLDVWMNDARVARWTHSPSRGHQLAYYPGWLDDARVRPLSLSLPLSSEPIAGPRVEAWFDNLLPDSIAIRKRLAAKTAAGSIRPFELLTQIGRDCAGAVQLLPVDEAPSDIRRVEAHPLDDAQIERLLDATVGGSTLGGMDDDDLRVSIAGAQEKTALLRLDGQWLMPHGTTPTTHILKLPLGEVGGRSADFSTSVENEWLCARLLNSYGLTVCECEIVRFGRHKVLVVERFDRRRVTDWVLRLPQEDFCQAYGLTPEQKYENHGGPGMSAILDTLRGSDRPELDRLNFLSAQLVFWMLAAPDGHAKNFSLFLEANGAFRSTPLYDVVSAWPVIGKGPSQLAYRKAKLAMALHSKSVHYLVSRIQARHWDQAARSNAVGPDFDAVMSRYVAATDAVIAAVSRELPHGFPAEVSDRIFEGLRRHADVLRTG